MSTVCLESDSQKWTDESQLWVQALHLIGQFAMPDATWHLDNSLHSAANFWFRTTHEILILLTFVLLAYKCSDRDDSLVVTSAQQTWSSPPPLLGAKEFDSGEDVKSTGFLTVSFGFTGAAHAAAGIRLLPLPRLPFLPDEGAGNRRSHGQFCGTPEERTPVWWEIEWKIEQWTNTNPLKIQKTVILEARVQATEGLNNSLR